MRTHSACVFVLVCGITTSAAGLTVPPGFTTRDVTSSLSSTDPRGVAIDGTTLFVAGATTVDEVDLTSGSVIQLVVSGISAGNRLVVGDGRAFFGNDLFLSDHNQNGAFACCDGSVFRVTTTSGTLAAISIGAPSRIVGDPAGLAFGSGGGFGDSLYVMDFQGASSQPPLLFRINTDGTRETFFDDPINWDLNSKPREIRFGDGNGFGSDLYVADESQIWRLSAAKQLSLFATGFTDAEAIGFGHGGQFGTDMYVLDSGAQLIRRVTLSGVVSTFASDLPPGFGHMAFSADGSSLYLAAGSSIVAIEVPEPSAPLLRSTALVALAFLWRRQRAA